MMRPNMARKAKIKSIPAPVGGLNARDAYADMPEKDAPIMENFFPMPSYVMPRLGNLQWATGLPGNVTTVACYSPPSGSRKLFAASAGGIYDVTAKAAVGLPVVTGQTLDWWQTVNFGAGGGQYLVMVNGQDHMQIYNGSTWQQVTAASAPIAITGVDTSTLVNVNVYQGRLFFMQKNSTQVWYLPLNSVGGAATMLDFSTQLLLGGSIIAMATWTLQTSDSSVQLACFISSEGEIVVYQGIDPSLAATWTLVGTFRIGRPVGYRCQCKVGSDIVIICADGLVPLSKAVLTDRQSRGIAVSDKIVNLINNDVQAYTSLQGWQVILYPIGNKLIVNVPAYPTCYQYVMNTLNGSWTKFTGWNGYSWATMGDSLFYGDVGVVYQADVGQSDSGTAITCRCVQAPSYFGSSEQKLFTMARPVVRSNGNVQMAFQLNVDIDLSTPSTVNTFNIADETPWFSPWFSQWTGEPRVYATWLPVGSIGYIGSVSLAMLIESASPTWQSTDVAYQVGGPL